MSTDSGGILLEVRDLARSFGGVRAVQNVDMKVAAGELRSVIGPNGAGKTTLFNLLAGVMFPTRGQIAFDGHDITRVPVHKRVQRGIARTFQTPQPFMAMSVLENVIAGAHVRGRGDLWGAIFGTPLARAEEHQAREQAMRLLDFVGVRGRDRELCGTLSYGHQRRVEIARALASEPRLLLLDEPMAGLSPSERAGLIDLIRDINRRTTIVLVEHNMRVVMGLSDRVSVLDFGACIAEGTPAEVSANPEVIEAYLGTGDLDLAAS